MEPVPEEETMREALNRLDDSRSRFHDQFSGWGGLIRLSSLPEEIGQAILDTTTMGSLDHRYTSASLIRAGAEHLAPAAFQWGLR